MALPLFEQSTLSFVCISDTHNDTPSKEVPAGDILLHAGDMTDNGSFEELQSAYKWIMALPHKVKVVVAGNHDLGLDPNHERFSHEAYSLFTSEAARQAGLHYLDRETREIARYLLHDGTTRSLKIYGNPCQPDFLASSYCFTYLPFPDPSSVAAWETVPARCSDADIWLTHSPPKGRLDAIPVPPLIGCEVLAGHIAAARPLLTVFGHYHSSYGVEKVVWESACDKVKEVIVLSKYHHETTFDLTDANALKTKHDTIFVNAAWMTMQKRQTPKRNTPWLLKIDLEIARPAETVSIVQGDKRAKCSI